MRVRTQLLGLIVVVLSASQLATADIVMLADDDMRSVIGGTWNWRKCNSAASCSSACENLTSGPPFSKRMEPIGYTVCRESWFYPFSYCEDTGSYSCGQWQFYELSDCQGDTTPGDVEMAPGCNR